MSLSRSSTPSAPLAADPSLSGSEPRPALPRPAASTRSKYSFDLYAAMITLAEDPAEYRRLRDELIKAHDPKNVAQRMLVEDIAWLRWQKRRNLRGQSGLMVQARERILTERRKRRQEVDRELTNASAAAVAEHGLIALPDSPSKFEKMERLLDLLIEQVRRNDFTLDFESALTQLYGVKRSTLRATKMTNGFRCLQRLAPRVFKTPGPAVAAMSPSPRRDDHQVGGEDTAATAVSPSPHGEDHPVGGQYAAAAAPDTKWFVPPPDEDENEIPATPEAFEYERVMLLNELLDERHLVEQAYQWHRKEHIELTPALLDTCFVPQEREGRTLRLQERTYDREIERKIRLLIEMKSRLEKGDDEEKASDPQTALEVEPSAKGGCTQKPPSHPPKNKKKRGSKKPDESSTVLL